MMHIIVGLFSIALGIWGVFDEWYYVVDVVKGGSSLLLIAAGLVGMFAGVVPPGDLPERATVPQSSDPKTKPEGEESHG